MRDSVTSVDMNAWECSECSSLLRSGDVRAWECNECSIGCRCAYIRVYKTVDERS